MSTAAAVPNSILSHVSVGTNDFSRATAFYDAVLATLGIRRVMAHDHAVAYGRDYPEFWVQAPFNGLHATHGNGTHFAFVASNREQVQDFYDAALKAGGKADGAPGPRPHYGHQYYGCYVRDLDGHKIEATFWDENAQP